MNRRKFIEKSGVLGIATILPVSYTSLVKEGLTFLYQTKTPANFGAVGDGVTDDTNALIKWGEWAFNSSEQLLFFDRNAVYYTSSELRFKVKKRFDLDGQNAKILRDYKGAKKNEVGLEFTNQGTKFTKNLAEDVQKGSMDIIVTDADKIQIGHGVYLDGGVWRTNGPHKYRKGMMSIVSNITGNIISLKDPIPHDFRIDETIRLVFIDPFPITIKNIRLESINHLEEERALGVRHFRLNNFFYPEITNIRFESQAYMLFQPRNIYGGIFDTIYTSYEVTNLGGYGISPSLTVHTYYKNFNIKSNSHAMAFTGSASYGVRVENSTFKSSKSITSFDSHVSLGVRTYNCTFYGISWGYGKLHIECGLLRPVQDKNLLIRYRNTKTARQVHITVANCEIESNGYQELMGYGGEIESPSQIRFINNRFNNEDLEMLPYSSTIFENNLMVLPDKFYSLPNNSTWTIKHEKSYYNFGAASQGIKTPVSLSGLSGFSLFVKAKLASLDEGIYPLAGLSNGFSDFWFRIVKRSKGSSIMVRTLNDNGKGINHSIHYAVDLNVRTYGFTFDVNNEIRFYVDGFFIGKSDFKGRTYSDKNQFLTIGEQKGSIFNGTTDEVLFYDRTLNHEEIAQVTLNPKNIYDYIMYLGTNKTPKVWIDESTHGNDGAIGSGINLVQ